MAKGGQPAAPAAETPAADAPATEAATTVDPVAAAVAAAVTAVTEGASASDAPVPIPTKIIPAVPLPEPERDPNVPSDRDAVLGDDVHRGTMLIQDLVRLHYYLWKKEQQPEEEAAALAKETKEDDDKKDDAAKKPKDKKDEKTSTPAPTKVEPPQEAKDVEELAARLYELFGEGRKYELSGLKDVPTPFFKPGGRFFEKLDASETETDDKKKWKRLDEAGAKERMAKLLVKTFTELAEADNKELEKAADAAEESESSVISKSVDSLFENVKLGNGDTPADPRPYDVIFLPVHTPWEENMTHEHSSGNKNLLYLASQHVSVDTKESIARVKAAFALITTKVQVSSGTELVTKDQRFCILKSTGEKGINVWESMDRNDLAEFAAIFVFEVYLEKRIYEETVIGNSIIPGTPVTPGSTQAAMKDLLSPSAANKPSDVPIPHPTTHDVLFGRGYVPSALDLAYSMEIMCCVC